MEILGPWRVLRFLFRTTFWSFLTWVVLALLWAGLPFPTHEHEGDNGADYATSVLRSGGWSTRVYFPSSQFGVDTGWFRGFALDYRLHAEDLSLEIAGYEHCLSIMSPKVEVADDDVDLWPSDLVERLNVTMAALIWFIASTAVFVNDYFGPLISATFNIFSTVFVVVVYVFHIVAVVVSLWRCLGGRFLPSILEWMQIRLDRLKDFETLRLVRIDMLKEALERFREAIVDNDTWIYWFLQICREGWHPEMMRALREEAKTDLESNGITTKAGVCNGMTSGAKFSPEKALYETEVGFQEKVATGEGAGSTNSPERKHAERIRNMGHAEAKCEDL